MESPGYPLSYTSDSICQYDIYPSSKDIGVRLDFKTFDVEASEGCQNDNLTIYNGSISTSNIIEVKCGKLTGDAFYRANKLIAVFRSDSKINSKGYNITVEREYFSFMKDSQRTQGKTQCTT